jgi:hypothetical protein
MGDITLTQITSGYNLSNIQNNFDILEAAINNAVLNLSLGNNQMGQDLDMNSWSILNTRTSSAGSSLVTRDDLQDIITSVLGESGAALTPTLAGIAVATVVPITVDYVFTADDIYNYFRTTGTAPIVFTMNAIGALVGAEIHVRQQGTGLVTILPGAGVTINEPYQGSPSHYLAGTGATITLKHVGSNEWDLMGQVLGV